MIPDTTDTWLWYAAFHFAPARLPTSQAILLE